MNNILATLLPAHNNGKGLQSDHLLPYSTQALTLECMTAKSQGGHVLKCLVRSLAMIPRTNPGLFATISFEFSFANFI